MKYIDDFNSKWGFNDGDSIPPDAREVRAVIVYAVNFLAKATQCPFRYVPLFRNGMHNYFLLTTRPAEEVDGEIAALGLWNFAEGYDPGTRDNWVAPTSCWETLPLEALRAHGELWQAIYDACDGTGEIEDCDSDIAYGFVNSRNQIRKKALELWCRRVAKSLIKKYPAAPKRKL
jgi:hypothetical protein